MAKKTVFKGVINGKEFDNVQAYNQEMQNLVANGVDINASSQTSIEDDKSCCDCEKCEQCEKCQESIDFLPYFSNPQEYYLDRLITENVATNDKNIEELKMFLTQTGKHILNSVNKMDEHTLENYKNDLKDVIKTLDSDKIDNKKSLDSLSKKINILHYADEAINLLNDFYSTIYNRITDIKKSTECIEQNKPTIEDGQDDIFNSIFGPVLKSDIDKKNLHKLLNILDQSFDELFGKNKKNMA